MIEVNPWMIGMLISTFLLFSVVLVGGVYTYLRETQFRTTSKQLEKSGATLVDISHSLNDVCRALDSNADLSREHKADLKQLVLDVEKRICEQVKENRNWMSMLNKHGAGANVNIHGGTSQNSFGDDNTHRQR